MNRTTNPHRGGVPKGYSWTRNARLLLTVGEVWGGEIRLGYLRQAARIVRDHSRKPETRAEAERLLAVLEATSRASEARAECLRSGPLFRQAEAAPAGERAAA